MYACIYIYNIVPITAGLKGTCEEKHCTWTELRNMGNQPSYKKM